MNTGETELFGAGNSYGGQLGESIIALPKFKLIPTKHLTTARIVQVTCSDYHTTFLTSDNKVFITGSMYDKKFKQLDFPNMDTIVHITSTRSHVLLLSITGDLYEVTEEYPDVHFLSDGVSQVVAGGKHHVTNSTSFYITNN
jgi:alpha-tubulin suppressor-like RCC1 family protein